MTFLRVYDPSGASTDYPLDPKGVTVSGGGLPASGEVIQLQNRHGQISRRHATIRRVGPHWEIEDHSTNGTVVDGHEYRQIKTALHHGSELRFDDVIASFHQEDAAARRDHRPEKAPGRLEDAVRKIQILRKFTANGQIYLHRLRDRITELEQTVRDPDPERVRSLLAQDYLAGGGLQRDVRAIEDTYAEVLAAIAKLEEDLLGRAP